MTTDEIGADEWVSEDTHVSKDKLREKIEEWREQSNLQTQFGNEVLAEMAKQHADELEELLNE